MHFLLQLCVAGCSGSSSVHASSADARAAGIFERRYHERWITQLWENLALGFCWRRPHRGSPVHVRNLQLAIPSAITSGDTEDFQTFELNAWTSGIQIQPRFTRVNQWISIKEVRTSVLLCGDLQGLPARCFFPYFLSALFVCFFFVSK